MPFLIRRYTPADQEFVLSLAERFTDFDLPDWRSAAELDTSNHLALQKTLADPEPDSVIWIAVDEETGRPAGFAHVHSETDFFNGKTVGYLSDLAVDKAYEGQGVGRMLLQTAEDWALMSGYPQLALNVFASNVRARQMYEKFGFQQEVVKYVKPLGNMLKEE